MEEKRILAVVLFFSWPTAKYQEQIIVCMQGVRNH